MSDNRSKSAPYIIFTREGCGYCLRAAEAISASGGRYILENIDSGAPDFLQAITGASRPSVPQIFHMGEHIGGFSSLELYLKCALTDSKQVL